MKYHSAEAVSIGLESQVVPAGAGLLYHLAAVESLEFRGGVTARPRTASGQKSIKSHFAAHPGCNKPRQKNLGGSIFELAIGTSRGEIEFPIQSNGADVKTNEVSLNNKTIAKLAFAMATIHSQIESGDNAPVRLMNKILLALDKSDE